MKKGEMERLARFLWDHLDDDDKQFVVQYDTFTYRVLSGDIPVNPTQKDYSTALRRVVDALE